MSSPARAPTADAAALAALARRADPADPGAQNNLGVVLLARGQRDEAAAAFARALALDPRMTLARRNLEAAGGTALRSRRAATLRARLRANGADADARRELAQVLAESGRMDEARAELERLCAQRPRDPAPRVHRALCAQAAGDLDDAARWLDAAIALDERAILPRLHLAEVLYHRGEPGPALAAVDAALALAPDHADAHHLRAFVLGELGRPEAADASARARELNPSFARTQPNLAAVADAPPAAATAPVAAPNDRREGHLALGVAFREKGYFDEAVREYRRALARGEDEALVSRALAELHLLRGAPLDAEPLWARLTVLRPDDASAWHGRAIALHLAGLSRDADVCYREAARLAGGAGAAAARVRNDLGVLRAATGDLTGAARAFAAATAADAALVVAHLNRAAAFLSIGQAERALAEYRGVLARTPDDAEAWAGVGAVLAAGGRHEEARSAFGRALDVDPSRDDVRYELAFVAAALGEHDAALRETERAMAGTSLVVKRGFALAFDFGAGADETMARGTSLSLQRIETSAVPGFALGEGAVDALLGTLLATPDVVEAPSADDAPYAVAEECLRAGLYDRAASEATRALTRGADRALGLTLLADAFAAQGFHGEALERYVEARGVDPSSRRARRGELRMLRETGRHVAARDAAHALLAAHPDDAYGLALGALVADLDTPADALRAMLRDAVDAARRAGDPDVWRHVAEGWRVVGDADAEVAAHGEALLVGGDVGAVGLALARALVRAGRVDDACAELQRLIDADVVAAEARVELSSIRAQAGDRRGARALLVDVLASDPLHHDALAALAALLVDDARASDARVAVDRVLRADPDHALAVAVDGDLLDRLGAAGDAWRRWERAVALEPFGDGGARARRSMAGAA